MLCLVTLKYLAPALLLVLACGCGSDDTSGTPASGGSAGTGGLGGAGGVGSGKTCSELLPECLENQQQCVEGSSGASCEACPSGKYADESGSCAALVGTPHAHDFPEQTVGAGEEAYRCRSWTLDNDTELFINAVELEQNEASHHSNWMFVPEDQYPGPDGLWDCKDRGYSQLAAALAGGALYAQSTQAKREVQKFPDGVAVRIPPRSKITSDTHLLNTTKSGVTGNTKFTIYALDPKDVTVRLAPFHLDYHGLAIPPKATSRFSAECDLLQDFGGSLDAKLFYLLPHTHALGSRVFVELLGGPNDGQSLLDVRGFNGEARGKRFGPAVDLSSASGFRFGCEFKNPRNSTIKYGIGDQEMCEVLGFFESPMAFESRVDEAKPGPTDGDIQTFTGACNTAAFSWAGK
ncbi:MAG TPA: hypothetical protein PKA88_21750 [Polyangiaceae bacterium]|nr:hypothetical protein [Polyangiaceae bacterium]